jgi:hypothetical protein
LVAKTLQAVEAAWIEADFPDKARQRVLATQMVDAALPKKS